ncbi:hypothetical protein Ari01nite_66040 [Paractinoplanes rishiriensis]|uniref:Uncharacterized protein n=1 Tax=Paractinoplanes rishiriensis TaxID=1050105 RepID=A0A919K5J5_9ACTN|nr:hypothetical protein Ari01nite_66040 [Actinoplanes rishiriensis]
MHLAGPRSRVLIIAPALGDPEVCTPGRRVGAEVPGRQIDVKQRLRDLLCEAGVEPEPARVAGDGLRENGAGPPRVGRDEPVSDPGQRVL